MKTVLAVITIHPRNGEIQDRCNEKKDRADDIEYVSSQLFGHLGGENRHFEDD